jgi:Fe-S cluster assembly protein SufD
MEHIIDRNQHIILYDQAITGQVNKHFVITENACVTYIFLIVDQADISITVELSGIGGLAYIFGICVLSDQQRLTITTCQDHRGVKSASDVLIKSVVGHQASINYNGVIMVNKGALKSKATQYNKNILIGPDAHAWSCPSLEVSNNDVCCKHGSATARLDSDQLVYMGSRGFCPQTAQMLLLQGFFVDILEKIDNTSYRQKIDETIASRLSYITQSPY